MPTRTSLTSSLLTRPSLLFRLRDWEDQTSWEEFDRLYRRFIYGLAVRAGLTHSEAEDVVQEVLQHVAEKISEYEMRNNRGAFRRWLMNQTRWRISDKFRERKREPLATDAVATDPAAGGWDVENWSGPGDEVVDGAWESEWQQHVLDAALERLARRAPPKQFQAFELYSRQGWTISRIATELGMSRATIYLLNHRLTKQLKQEVQRLRRSLE